MRYNSVHLFKLLEQVSPDGNCLFSYTAPYDIGSIAVCANHLSQDETFRTMKTYTPPRYVFPNQGEGKSCHQWAFQSKWLADFTWLAYNVEEDGGFCVPSAFF